MSILKYYKVESDGKIKRLRRECPSAECGAGIFVSPSIPFAALLCLNEYSSLRWPSTRTVSTAASAGSPTSSSPGRSPLSSKPSCGIMSSCAMYYAVCI